MFPRRSRALVTLFVSLAIGLSLACGNEDGGERVRDGSHENLVTPDSRDRSSASAAGGGIVCDRFDLRAERVGDHLEVWLESDLPDSAQIYLTVFRSFFPKNSDETAGALTYYSNPTDGSETVARWRNRVRIPIDDSNARVQIEEQMQFRAIMGQPSALDRVAPSVSLMAGLVLAQQDPRFEAGVTGQAAEEIAPGIYTISDETSVLWEFAESWEIGPFGNPENLERGTTYVLERETMLMAYHELRGSASVDEVVDQISAARALPAGTSITVRQRLEKTKIDVWYEVEAANQTGWINGVALTAQVLPVRSVSATADSQQAAIAIPVDEIANRCAAEWPADFAMQVDCRAEQTSSWQAIEAARGAFEQKPVWSRIEAHCRNEWKDGFGFDYAMVEYCAVEQIEAARAIGAF